nr:MAG TPA: hypothetical protein [Caudoviricetes sp.]
MIRFFFSHVVIVNIWFIQAINPRFAYNVNLWFTLAIFQQGDLCQDLIKQLKPLDQQGN